MNTLHDNRVRARAFAIWEAAGRPNGHDLDHWLRAEREVMGEMGGRDTGAAAPRAGEEAPARPSKARKRSPAAAKAATVAPEKVSAKAAPARTTGKKEEVL